MEQQKTGTDLHNVALLIPVRQPDAQLPALLHTLAAFRFGSILLVDDGSSPDHAQIFAQARTLPGVQVLRHEKNLGKGSALKTGIAAFLRSTPQLQGLVTADADGQHHPEDIGRVAQALQAGDRDVVLGSRSRTEGRTEPVPLRSALGNRLTRGLLRLLYGVRLQDTQTGLRGFARNLLPELLTVPGERYEYEMAVLVQLCRRGVSPLEIPVSTIYLEGNRRSHFRPLADSLRVYAALLRPLLHPLRHRTAARAAALHQG